MTEGQRHMPTPLVSLLVPVYNVEKYLAQCLDSACGQTLEDIEIICINDGSSDSSRDIIQSYVDEDERFRVIDKPNSGYGASMNKGLNAALGKYVGILESDDFMEPDALEKLFNAAEREEAQVAKANFWLHWSTPQPRDVLFEVVPSHRTNCVVDTQREYDIYYSKDSIWSAIYRRDFLFENGIRFLETPGASYQDTSFDFKVWACAQRVVFLADPVVHYRQDNEASSVNSSGKVYCVCDEYSEIHRFLEEDAAKNHLIPIVEKMKYDAYMWNYERLASDLAGQFIRRFGEEFRNDVAKGIVDFSLFEPHKIQDLEALMSSPEKFHAWYCCTSDASVFKRAKLLFDAKGWSALFAAIKGRFLRR